MTLTLQSKRIIAVCAAVGLLIIVVFGFAFYHNRPERTLRAFLDAVKAQDIEAAMQFAASDLTDTQKEDITFFLEDWASSKNTVYVLGKDDAAWRTRDTMTTVDGKKVPAVDKKGKAIKEIRPTPHYWSHFYERYVTVSFDDYEDEVIIRLRRETKNTWSRLAQIFSPWKVTKIEYQPVSEDDLDGALFLDDSEDDE